MSERHSRNGDWSVYIATVLQASDIISVQANCTPDEALDLLKNRAGENHISLDELADSVVIHQTRFG